MRYELIRAFATRAKPKQESLLAGWLTSYVRTFSKGNLLCGLKLRFRDVAKRDIAFGINPNGCNNLALDWRTALQMSNRPGLLREAPIK